VSDTGETKTITGRCEEVSEKNGWTTFSVDVGTQYPVRLSTKLEPLIELGRAAVKDGGVFVWTFKESQGGENPHRPGTHYINRYLSGVEPAAEGAESAPDATPGAGRVSTSPRAQNAADAMTKEEWARKDSAIHKMACIKTAADALKHTLPSEPSTEDLDRFSVHVMHLALTWHRSVIAERDDPTGEGIPF
jgi:hypothetical protein